MEIGIAGVGVIGGALERWLVRDGRNTVLCYDPAKGRGDLLASAKALFICVPVPTFELEQDLTNVRDVLTRFSRPGQVVFIRSTVLPGTCDKLSKEFGRSINALPEFLTERIADSDMDRQHLIAGYSEDSERIVQMTLSCIFAPRKEATLMRNVEAELAKYAHNGNGAVKVGFNNLIYDLAFKLGASYANVRKGMLMSGYVSPEHTLVPGPDSKRGYGGTCFPKDLDALIGLCERVGVQAGSLHAIQDENRQRRR